MHAAGRYVNTIGVQMPPDAARPEDQVLRLFLREGRSMEHFGSVYQGMQAMWVVAEPLIRRDKDFQLLPAGAESWSVSDDGLVWTFHIQPGLQFSDGRPLNADDYVYSFRRGADPGNAYDGEFYFHGIKHWQDVVGRRRPIEDLGVYAPDEQTLKITTNTPMPHLPQLLTFSHVTPRQAVEKYGDTWSTRAETYISSGPFLVHAWAKRDQLTLKANPTYQGPAKPYLEQGWCINFLYPPHHRLIWPPIKPMKWIISPLPTRRSCPVSKPIRYYSRNCIPFLNLRPFIC
jgi:ABC-type transport system substrate-binding protein